MTASSPLGVNEVSKVRDLGGLLRTLFEHSIDGILLSKENGNILAANPAACRMLARSEQDIVAGGREQVVDISDPEVHLALAERNRSGSVFTVLTFMRGDGSSFPAELMSTVFVDSNGERLTSMFFRDVTERLRLERVKSEFVASVSHELRTPLTAIRGVLGLLSGGILGTLPEAALEHVQMAISNADRLSRLVDDILDLSKIESGHLSVRPTPTSVLALLDAALSVGRGLVLSAEVQLRLSVQTHETLVADQDRITQVLANLISNAVKFAPRGSVVELVARSVAEKRIRFEVIDQGEGIAAEDIPKLFQRFSQVGDRATPRTRKGTGLGLAISKAIVLAHHGEIGVDSVKGQGSTFWFELPVKHGA